MHARIFAAVAVLAIAFWVIGCQFYAPGIGPEGRPSMSLSPEAIGAACLSPQDVSDAARLYVAKCARCHKFYDPNSYSDVEWQSWMFKMSKKAHLKSDQVELLSRYLEAFRDKRSNHKELKEPKLQGAR